MTIKSYKNDPIFQQPTGSALRNSKFLFDESTGIWTYLDRIYIPKGGEIKRRSIYECHDAIVSGHPLVNKNIACVMSKFDFLDVRLFVNNYVDECIICKRAKMIQLKKASADPLLVPPDPWHTCGMDFICDGNYGPLILSAIVEAV